MKLTFLFFHRALVDNEDVIEEHSSVGQLKATNDECTSVTLEECFQVYKPDLFCVQKNNESFDF